MLPLASLDGIVGPAGEAAVPVTDDGFLRGDGVFEAMRVYAGAPFALDEHVERMRGSMENLRLDGDVDQLVEDARRLIAYAGPVDAALRLVLTRGGRRLAMLEPLKQRPASIALQTVTYAPTRILDAVKSLSYAANMLATRTAQAEGADDALLVTPHGRVLEAPTASFFYVLDGRLHTPPLSDHILDSITRRHVVELTGATERVTTRDDLTVLDEAFVTSSLREVLPVTRIDDRALDAGPQAQEAHARLRDRIAEATRP